MTGKQVTGTLEAGGERDVASILSERSLFPVQVKESASAGGGLSFVPGGRKKVNGQTLSVFYSQLASLLKAGVPMVRALNVLGEQSSSPVLMEVVQDIRGKVEDGETLGDAMARYPRIFSEMGCNMVRAGSEGGFLEDALNRVGDFTELQEDLKGRTVSAMAYPIFLFSVGSIVLSALLVFFVPKFDMLFERLRAKGEMPKMTEWLLDFSMLLQSYGWLLLLALVASRGRIAHAFQNRRGATSIGPMEIEDSRTRKYLDELGGRAFLPSAGNVVRQWSSYLKIAGN